jgi:transposase
MPQVDVITGAPRQRRWSLEEKQSLVAAAFAPGAVVAHVAQRANISTSQLYTWRKELTKPNRGGQRGFSRVVAVADPSPVPALPPPQAPVCELPVIELEIRGRKVRIPPTTPAPLAVAIIRAVARR